MAGVGKGAVVAGLEREIGYIVAEQKNQNVDTHLCVLAM